LIRASRKLYFEQSLKISAKDPKKSWAILKEALNLSNKNTNIWEIFQNGTKITDPTEIANTFHNFPPYHNHSRILPYS